MRFRFGQREFGGKKKDKRAAAAKKKLQIFKEIMK